MAGEGVLVRSGSRRVVPRTRNGIDKALCVGLILLGVGFSATSCDRGGEVVLADPRTNDATVPSSCGGPEALLSSNAALDRAAKEHTPSTEEIRRAAAIWAVVLDALAMGEARQKLLKPELAQLLAGIPAEYPSLYGLCAPSGASSQALIQAKSDFACGNSCAPSAELFKDTGGKVFEKAVGKTLDVVFEGSKVVQDGIAVADDLEQMVDGGETYAAGLVNLTFSKDPVQFIGGIGQVVKGGSAIVASNGNPAAATVVAVISAFEIGFELGSAANLVIECVQWKADNCCEPGEKPRCSGACCASVEWCADGKCCPLGTVVCDGLCVNGSSDEAHCGASTAQPCGSVCSPGTKCHSGVCDPATEGGLIDAGAEDGAVADSSSDSTSTGGTGGTSGAGGTGGSDGSSGPLTCTLDSACSSGQCECAWYPAPPQCSGASCVWPAPQLWSPGIPCKEPGSCCKTFVGLGEPCGGTVCCPYSAGLTCRTNSGMNYCVQVVPSCQGNCGSGTFGYHGYPACWCDGVCEQHGDCCQDKKQWCG